MPCNLQRTNGFGFPTGLPQADAAADACAKLPGACTTKTKRTRVPASTRTVPCKLESWCHLVSISWHWGNLRHLLLRGRYYMYQIDVTSKGQAEMVSRTIPYAIRLDYGPQHNVMTRRPRPASKCNEGRANETLVALGLFSALGSSNGGWSSKEGWKPGRHQAAVPRSSHPVMMFSGDSRQQQQRRSHLQR